VNPGLTSGAMALPLDPKQEAKISFSVDGEHRQRQDYDCHYKAEDEAWLGKQRGRPVNPGLVLYAMADGAFAVWDSARNAWEQKGNIDKQDKVKAYVFSGREVWQGLPNSDSRMGWFCNGLVRDWANWQRENGEPFQQLKDILHTLSPNPMQRLEPGPRVRLRVSDTTDYPTIKMGNSSPVPVVHGSSGVRRILALSYLLVWAWQEHQLASTLLGKEPVRQVIFLIDEVEVHLHPSWQRRIVGSLLQVLSTLNQATSIQMLLVTHSPLVMASVEPHFDPDQDCWWDLDLNPETRQVELIRQNFTRLGDANSWLRSDAFHQDDTGSPEREDTLRKARRAIHQRERGEAVDSQEVQRLEQKLQKVLGSTDPFWNRWRLAERQGGWRP